VSRFTGLQPLAEDAQLNTISMERCAHSFHDIQTVRVKDTFQQPEWQPSVGGDLGKLTGSTQARMESFAAKEQAIRKLLV